MAEDDDDTLLGISIWHPCWGYIVAGGYATAALLLLLSMGLH